MERHFHEELKQLKEDLLRMGLLVESAIGKAVKALLDRDERSAEEVFEEEKMINQREIEIDEKGHSLFALSQPLAADLRLMTAILKMNTDLERMGDHAVNIAERALAVMKEAPFHQNVHLPEMAQAVKKMLRDVLDAFVQDDATLARHVLKSDDEVDAYNDDLYYQIVSLIQKNPDTVKTGMNLVMAAHNLERIADLANNIAEDVIYLKQGKEVRHRFESSESS